MYRTLATRDEDDHLESSVGHSDELSAAAVLGAVWVVSVLRAAIPCVRGEAFDGEASFALVVALLVPYLIVDSASALLRKRHTRRVRDPYEG